MQIKFVNRERELRLLEEAWQSGQPGFIIVYGRRRIGKTRLLVEWARNKPHLYVQCLPASDEVNLSRLSMAIADQLGLESFRHVKFNGLDHLLIHLSRIYDDRLIIILDEFTYWASHSSKMLGELQYFIDHYLLSTKFLLIVSGSLVGVMYRDVLGYGSPLYGRRTAALRVEELSPWYVKEFVDIPNKKDRVRIYGLVGGLPYYLSYIYGSRSLQEAVEKLFGSRISPIYDEPYLLFREEFRNPQTYYSVVAAIAYGYNRLSSISDYTGIPRTHLPKYLKILVDLGYIEYVKPLFSRRGWYRVRDHILRTWFKIIEPRIHLVEAGYLDKIVDYVLKNIDMFIGEVYEKIVYRYVLENILPKLGKTNILVGKYLYRGVEIDLVVLLRDKRRALVYEVKWSDLNDRELDMEYNRLLNKIEKTPLRDYTVNAYIVTRKSPRKEYVVTLDEIPM